METRIIRDKSKGETDEPTIVAAVTWATLIQESTKDVWPLSDSEIVEMINAQTAGLLDYDTTHDEMGNPVDAMVVRLGKGGYSVHTVFDEALDTETVPAVE